jgi:hypothetical protein
MNSRRCCQGKFSAERRAGRRSSLVRGAREMAGLVLPGALLALMPKCPLCFAAYVAFGTGITMSCTSASLVMRALTWLSVGALAFCLSKRIMNRLHKPLPNLSLTNTP